LRGPRNDEASLRTVAPRFGAAEMRDLQVLSKLAWFDLDWREKDAALRTLIAKGRDYTEEDKRVLAERERALLAAVVPAYRRAADEGRIELSASPYYHAILPLLCDSDVHREAHPGAYVPRRFRHPEDAADQIRRAVDRHTVTAAAPPIRWTSSIGPGSAARPRARSGCSSATARSATSSASATRARTPSTPPTTCSSASAASATPGRGRGSPATRWSRSSWTARTPGSTSGRAGARSSGSSTPVSRAIPVSAPSP